jgi:outer membrane protein OmpA-like peptidoglycan-associated protein
MLLAAAAAMTFGLAGCAGQTPSPNLEAATQAVNAASNDPQVMKNAPLELQQARQSLERSQSLWRQEESRTDVDHYAYLAQRQAQIAQEAARLREAQATVADADAKRAQALLAARTTEAQQARQQAAMAQSQAAQAQSRAQTLEQQLEQLQSEQNADRGAVLTLGNNILFDVNGTTLKPGAYPAINQIASYLKQHPDRTVTIQGFTDNTGSSAHNDQLSQERAEAVRAALAQAGVDVSRVIARGLGESQPVASNDTAAGRQLNRRVDVLISDRSGNMPAQAVSGSSGRGGS